MIRISKIFGTENIETTSVPEDKINVSRHQDNKHLDQNSCEVMVQLREVMWEEKLGKPCQREQKHAHQLDLNIHNSNIKEKTGEKLILPGKEDGIDTNNGMNAAYLNRDSYARKKEVIILVGLLRNLFISLINMKQDKEAITEEETETRSEDIKHYCYHVHRR